MFDPYLDRWVVEAMMFLALFLGFFISSGSKHQSCFSARSIVGTKIGICIALGIILFKTLVKSNLMEFQLTLSDYGTHNCQLTIPNHQSSEKTDRRRRMLKELR